MMTTSSDRVNRFHREQQVRFIGGEGVVRNVKFESGAWKYLIEMPLGVEPNFGRIGAETMVLLSETELRAA
jgi:hypothetical protein